MIEKLNLGNNIDIGGHNINGEWIKSNTRLWGGNMTAGQVVTVSLADIIPNDGYDYEIQLCDWINTGTTSGNEVKIFIYPTTSASGDRICIDKVRTRTASSRFSSGNAIIPIKANNRNITIKNETSVTSGICGFFILEYRRIGTND